MNNLKNLVLECFEQLITDFGFEINSDDVNSYYVSLSNKKCIIRFGLDMGYLICMFVDPIVKNERAKIKRADGLPAPDPVYMMHSVWKFLYPDDSEVSGYNDSDLHVQASAIKKIF